MCGQCLALATLQAYRLHQALSEAIQRRDEWREKDKESPQQERERLLGQVKADNQEIASLEKRCIVNTHSLSEVSNTLPPSL